MSSGSKSLHNSAVPALQWAHSSSSSSDHPVKPSSPLVSDKLIKEETAPQQAEVDLRAQPRNLRPRKPRMQGGDAGGPRRSLRNVKEPKLPKLRISLTEEEIKEDLYSMTGGIPTRKPNKRSQSVKADLDKLFPGSKLDGIGADNYCAERGFKI
ncbi:hypothetical protein DCAR_0209621 [Daucus carota subsp. sativus]|uniref:Uncharacterized protein n=1 Tax=Daucus carota subsp. sativus TaxID=79200 RepID=A0A161XK86_DAUCS|nr:PREDICTED: uncharacterized protein LOC108207882 [Daucus carota subsp. sativus]WOG90377.1 hypothetical protein DCAR_0209621 [Daucus carota subsp. sativus]